MTLAIFSASEVQVRACFVRMRTLREQFQQQLPGPDMCAELSVGISIDFEMAIEEGSAFVRIGQALFGPRALPDSHYWPGAAPLSSDVSITPPTVVSIQSQLV